MSVKTFIIEGRYKIKTKMGKGFEKFKKEIKAISKEAALEKIHSFVGSHHGVKRRFIQIEKVKEVEQK